MRVLPLIALVIATGTAASAQDAVAGFIGDTVTTYDEPGAIDGQSVPTCSFLLPAPVLETSPALRILIDSVDGPVWVSSSDAVIAGLDELPRPFGGTGGGTEMAGGVRSPSADDLSVPDDNRSVPAPPSAAASDAGAEPDAATDAAAAVVGCPAAP